MAAPSPHAAQATPHPLSQPLPAAPGHDPASPRAASVCAGTHSRENLFSPRESPPLRGPPSARFQKPMSAPLSSQSSAQAAACARPGSRGGDPRCLATRGPNPEWRRRRRRKRKCPESRARQAWAPRPLGTPQEGTAPGQACSERGFPPGLGGLGRGPEHAAACEGTGRDAWPSARGQAMAWMLFFEVQNLGCAPRGGSLQ